MRNRRAQQSTLFLIFTVCCSFSCSRCLKHHKGCWDETDSNYSTLWEETLCSLFNLCRYPDVWYEHHLKRQRLHSGSFVLPLASVLHIEFAKNSLIQTSMQIGPHMRWRHSLDLSPRNISGTRVTLSPMAPDRQSIDTSQSEKKSCRTECMFVKKNFTRSKTLHSSWAKKSTRSHFSRKVQTWVSGHSKLVLSAERLDTKNISSFQINANAIPLRIAKKIHSLSECRWAQKPFCQDQKVRTFTKSEPLLAGDWSKRLCSHTNDWYWHCKPPLCRLWPSISTSDHLTICRTYGKGPQSKKHGRNS